MLTMGLPIEEVRQFINKQCLVNGLPESQSEALIVKYFFSSSELILN